MKLYEIIVFLTSLTLKLLFYGQYTAISRFYKGKVWSLDKRATLNSQTFNLQSMEEKKMCPIYIVKSGVLCIYKPKTQLIIMHISP
jgi:hypothetical protein